MVVIYILEMEKRFIIVLIKIKQVDIGSWDIINTSNSKVRNLVTTDDVGINLKYDEHLQFVDDTNETVRQN